MKKNYEVFQNFSDIEKDEILSYMKTKDFPNGSQIITEGESTSDLFFIEKGEVEITSYNKNEKEILTLAKLGEGDLFGELAVIDNKPRSNSAIAQGNVTVSMIPGDKIKDFLKKEHYFEKFTKGVIITLSSRLRKGNILSSKLLEDQIKINKKKILASNFAVLMICIITIYFFLFKFAIDAIKKLGSSTDISSVSLIILLTAILLFIKKTHQPWSQFGFNLKNLKKNLASTFLYTAPILALIVIGKWLIIKWIPEYHHLPLFSLGSMAVTSHTISEKELTWMLASYVFISSPIQEVIFRGALQSLFLMFLETKNKLLWTLICTNVFFSMMHLVISTSLAIVVFTLGVFWGWLFHKNQSIISPIFSHCLIGTWAFFIVGIQLILF